MVGGMLASAAVVLPVALPILPAAVLRTVPLQKINYDLAESIAWPKQVALVARAYDALPPAERRLTTILTGNYGEAGAIERYRADYGLPVAYSGANNFWLWGPPPARDTAAVAVNVDPALLRREFRRVRLVATFWNGLGVSDDEEGVQIFLATGLRSSWTRAWPAFRDYS
jgi:2-hydroxychromene-2-carboxylate isomerase